MDIKKRREEIQKNVATARDKQRKEAVVPASSLALEPSDMVEVKHNGNWCLFRLREHVVPGRVAFLEKHDSKYALTKHAFIDKVRPARRKPKHSTDASFVHGIHEHSTDGCDENLLILLHGLGDRPEAFIELGKKMSLPQTAIFAAAAPIALPYDFGGAWFEAFDKHGNLIDASDCKRLKSLEEGRQTLLQMVKHFRAHCGFKHIFAFGFGQVILLEYMSSC